MTDPIAEALELLEKHAEHRKSSSYATNPKPLLDVIEALVEKCENIRKEVEEEYHLNTGL